MVTGANKNIIGGRSFFDETALQNTTDFSLGLVIEPKSFQVCLNKEDDGQPLATWKISALRSELLSLKQEVDELGPKLKEVKVLYTVPYWTLVPKGLFHEDKAEEYLRFNHAFKSDLAVGEDQVLSLDSFNVYAFSPDIKEMITHVFPNARFSHQHSLFLELLMRLSRFDDQEKVYLHLTHEQAYISVFKEGRLLLTNSFNYQNEQDILFFLLYTLQQLKINLKSAVLHTSGLPIKLEAKTLLRKYFYNYEPLGNVFEVNQGSFSDEQFSENFILANRHL